MKKAYGYRIIKAYLTNDAGIHLLCKSNENRIIIGTYYNKKTGMWREGETGYITISQAEKRLKENKKWKHIREISIPTATDPLIPIPMSEACEEFECAIKTCTFIDMSSYEYYRCIECAKCSICERCRKYGKCKNRIRETCKECGCEQTVISIRISECKKCGNQIIPKELEATIKTI